MNLFSDFFGCFQKNVVKTDIININVEEYCKIVLNDFYNKNLTISYYVSKIKNIFLREYPEYMNYNILLSPVHKKDSWKHINKLSEGVYIVIGIFFKNSEKLFCYERNLFYIKDNSIQLIETKYVNKYISKSKIV